MSTHVVGFIPPDDKWRQMKAVYEACSKAQVVVPMEVRDFFNGEAPGNKPGMEVLLGDAAKQWHDDYRQGIEVNLKKLPPDVTILRFYNTW
jgi:hypothetical protein